MKISANPLEECKSPGTSPMAQQPQQPRNLFQVCLGAHQLQSALFQLEVPMVWVSYFHSDFSSQKVKALVEADQRSCFAKRFTATAAAFAGPLASPRFHRGQRPQKTGGFPHIETKGYMCNSFFPGESR